MSLANLGSHWWVILIIVVLLFGAPKLPALAKSMGQSMRIFKNEIKTGKDEDAAKAPAEGAPAAPTTTGTVPSNTVSSDNVAPGDTPAKS
jgi:sec-independent protein translocase protein TatA